MYIQAESKTWPRKLVKQMRSVFGDFIERHFTSAEDLPSKKTVVSRLNTYAKQYPTLHAKNGPTVSLKLKRMCATLRQLTESHVEFNLKTL